MIALGAVCALGGIVALCSAVRRGSVVERRLALLAPSLRRAPRWRPVPDRDLRQAAPRRTQTELVAAKLLGVVVGATVGACAGGFVGAAVPAAIATAYAGFVAPSIAVERLAAARRREAQRALGPLLERIEALVAAGRPVETAVAALARIPTASVLLDGALRRAADAYSLGAPLFRSLGAAAGAEGLAGLEAIAMALERARGLGRGSIAVIRDARDSARAAERAASLETAAKVEGKLMLTLVLCYLPALMLLVVIPLFLTLLDGLFG
jgi:pilus assembly protein TadC